MSLEMTILKTLFSSNLAISFCQDTIYCALVFLLIIISNLSITKQIFN